MFDIDWGMIGYWVSLAYIAYLFNSMEKRHQEEINWYKKEIHFLRSRIVADYDKDSAPPEYADND